MYKQTELSGVKFQSVCYYFEQQVQDNPSQLALIFSNQTLSYEILNQRANQLARFLQQRFLHKIGHAIRADTLIGLSMGRGVNMIIGILAILKTGAAYLPLDSSYPEERLEYMVNDAQIQLIISDCNSTSKIKFLQKNRNNTIIYDKLFNEIAQYNSDNITSNIKSNDLAYVIYTSGSSGRPKGVMIEHISLNYALRSFQAIFQLKPSKKCLQFASINFDYAVAEILGALISGATLCIAREEERIDPESLYKLINNQGINIATLPPALLQIFPKSPLPSLDTLAIGGDMVNQETVDYWAQQKTLLNLYGPTETTILATYAHLVPYNIANKIGKSIIGYQTYVLDDYLNQVNTGEPGELYIGGKGLARGYLNRPDLNYKKFIIDPFKNDSQLTIYKTGDRVKRLPDGNLKFLGRIDSQVKIRGFRIELGEIETLLSKHSYIMQVAVITKGEGEQKHLLCFFTTYKQNETVTAEWLYSYLSDKLPSYMIPSNFIQLDTMPLSPNGKIDHKALARINEQTISSEVNYLPPSNKLEEQLANIWQAILGLNRISCDKNFFYLGGNSLLSLRMLNTVKSTLNYNITLNDFFQHPTINAMANLIYGKRNHFDIKQLAHNDSQARPIYHSLIYNQKEVDSILLTGASGFLGIHLLSVLLKETSVTVYCLARNDDNQKNLEDKYYQVCKFAGISLSSEEMKRLYLIKGNLEDKYLSLSKKDWHLLCDNIDMIIHCGALVNHVYNYELLRQANVNSTITLLQLATQGKAKYFHYISTLSAANSNNEQGYAKEEGPGEQPPTYNGYVLSKWVSEQIVWQAFQDGLRGAIHRPGNITGHSKTGISFYTHNHFLLLLKSCIQLGVAPNWNWAFEMVPVNIIAQAIVTLSLNYNGGNAQVYHLGNPQLLEWQDYINYFRQAGYTIKFVEPDVWVKNYIQHINEDNALFALKQYYSHKENIHYPTTLYFNYKKTQYSLNQFNKGYTFDYSALIDRYIDFLQREDFI